MLCSISSPSWLFTILWISWSVNLGKYQQQPLFLIEHKLLPNTLWQLPQELQMYWGTPSSSFKYKLIIISLYSICSMSDILFEFKQHETYSQIHRPQKHIFDNAKSESLYDFVLISLFCDVCVWKQYKYILLLNILSFKVIKRWKLGYMLLFLSIFIKCFFLSQPCFIIHILLYYFIKIGLSFITTFFLSPYPQKSCLTHSPE